ncbi:OmpA family protein [Desulfatibacillum aliphaticivorans]|uniref:OmpA family protein n=1 Tax=Desulfatibacillum aliphaticivorans TaxID=218208 RepID=UPI000425519D|nr:OmpA family protein [Desulfatibacillum aliphaticivorans]
MKKLMWMPLIALVVLAMVSGCAVKQPAPAPFKVCDLNAKMGEYTQKVDNFLVILDKSGSMRGGKLGTAVNTLRHMNQTIPDLDLQAGLRTFGSICPFSQVSKLEYGMTQYVTKEMCGALAAQKKASGDSPMDLALSGAADDLARTNGSTAVILVSDGYKNAMDAAAAVAAAKELKSRYMNKVCIYTIQIGSDPTGKAILDKIVKAGGCGFSVNAADIADGDAMCDFVTKVFLKESNQPLDSDGDGVYDNADKCPGTPKGADVNKVGCWIIKDLEFDFDSYEIKKEYQSCIKKIVAILRANPGLKLIVEGHTDNKGSKAYNEQLSLYRADAVIDSMVGKGIMPERLSAKGYGFSKPVASNDTEEGRARNRRVQLTPVF